MINKICFFSVGFAYNRLVRMRYYEKIFPKNIKMYFFMTDKHNQRPEKYNLKRTKIVTTKYSKKFPLELRKFCKENEIDRVINIGNYMSGAILVLATIFTKTDYLENILGDIFNIRRHSKPSKMMFKNIINLLILYPLIHFSKKTLFNCYYNYKRAPYFFLTSKKKIKFLPAPLNTNFFKPKNKRLSRRKLKIKDKDKVIIYVGRIAHHKGSDLLFKIAKNNPDKKFIIIGRTVDKQLIDKSLKNIKIIESIENKKLIDYYNASDLCLFLSRSEGFGISFREAMACGTPTIISNMKSLGVVKPGIKVPFKIKGIQTEIDKFFKLSKQERKTLSNESREFIIGECSEETLKKDYIDIYLK
jgi:glycosyltransferase involved in cell wall biosynthesis